MRVARTAGQFTVEGWTDGSPIWTTVKGERVEMRFDFKEVYDLKYALERYIADIEAWGKRHD